MWRVSKMHFSCPFRGCQNEVPASCKWGSRGTANGHPEGPVSCESLIHYLEGPSFNNELDFMSNLGLTFLIIFKLFSWYSEFKIMWSPKAPKTNKFSLPRRLRPFIVFHSISIVDQHDQSMFKSWAAHLCALVLHLRTLCWHYSVFQNLPPSHPLYSRVPQTDAFVCLSLRPTCSFQTEAEEKSFLHY